MEFTRKDTKVIKGIAICLMLYHHLFAYPHKIMADNIFISLCSFGDTSLSTYIGQFGRICLPMFVFLSGYGCYKSSRRSDDLQGLVLRQMLGVYKSFWMVFVLFVPLSLFLFGIRPQPVQRELIYGFFGLHCSFNGEWWFVVPYVLLLLMFPAVKRFLERRTALLPTDLLWIALLNAFVCYVLPELCAFPVLTPLCSSVFWEHIQVMMGLLPGFALGSVFARYQLLDQVKSRFAGRLPWCILSLVGMAGLFYIHLYNYMFYDYINTALFIVCLVILLPTAPGRLAARILEALGEESTYICLTHSFFCYYWFQGLVFAPKYSILIFLWLLALSYGSSKLIRLVWKILGKLYAQLFPHTASV